MMSGAVTDIVRRASIPRGTARKLVEMMFDPDEAETAFRYLQDKGIDVGALMGAVIGRLSAEERASQERIREMRE